MNNEAIAILRDLSDRIEYGDITRDQIISKIDDAINALNGN